MLFSNRTTLRSDVRYSFQLLLILATLVSMVCSTDTVSHHLRRVVDGGWNEVIETIEHESIVDGRQLSSMNDPQPPPKNYVCDNALTIPSTFPGLLYTTQGVTIGPAVTNSTGPILLCNLPKRKEIVYRFNPAIPSWYNFTINSDSITCKEAHDNDQRCSKSKILQLNGKETSFIAMPVVANGTGILKLTVQRLLPASNSVCENATIIDPAIQSTIVTGDATFDVRSGPTLQPPDQDLCQKAFRSPTFWYKYTNPFSSSLSVVTTINKVMFPFTYYSSIMVYRGGTCDTSQLQCVVGKQDDVTYEFVANGLMSYFIVIQLSTNTYGPIPLNFTATIKTSKRFFSVIDPHTDHPIQSLQNSIDLASIPISTRNLNLQANFDLPPESVNSVRMTFDNPKRRYCDQQAPYSVFRDSNGDYIETVIPIGPHKITATPYALPNCSGPMGPTLEKRFNVTGCGLYYGLGNNATRGYRKRVFMAPFLSQLVSKSFAERRIQTIVPTGSNLSFPCSFSVSANVECGFPLKTVRIELRNGTTNELIYGRTRANFYSAYSAYEVALFGDNEVLRPLKWHPGSYTLLSIINNVEHPSVNFTVTTNTKCEF